MNTEIIWQQDCQFNVVSEDNFEFSIDANNKTAPCPTEILLSALGACSATDVAEGVKDSGGELKNLKNQLSYQLTDSEPQLYESVNLHFIVEANNISLTQLEQVVRDGIAKTCHVCLMLAPTIKITHSIEFIDA